MDDRHPWEQWPEEGVQIFEMFQKWMNDGRPKIAHWCKKQKRNTKTLQAMASKYKWHERAKSYLAHMESLKAAALRDRIEAAADKEAALILDALDWLEQSMAEHRASGATIPVRNWDAFLKRMIELRRLTNDKATASFSLDLRGADNESLEQLHELLSEIGEDSDPVRH